MSAPFTYELVSAAVGDLERAPVPGRSIPSGAWFALAEDQLPLLPALRAWLAERSAPIVSESGSRGPVQVLQEDRRYRLTAPRSVGGAVTGVPRSRMPCPDCGLPIETVAVERGARVRRRLPAEPLVSVMGACWAMRDGLLRDLDEADATVALRRERWAFDDGEAWAVFPERRLSGIAYPFGPDPCARCGRASRIGSAGPVFVPPRYAIGPALHLAPDAPPGWWWHEQYGQTRPIVDGRVARILRRFVPEVGVFLVVRADDPDAFLPAALR